MNPNTPDTKRGSTMDATTFVCASCCGPIAESLSRLGSVRCHDCLETGAPLREACAAGRAGKRGLIAFWAKSQRPLDDASSAAGTLPASSETKGGKMRITQTVPALGEQRARARELDHRESDGIAVTLVWYEDSDRVAVRVVDGKSDEEFELEIEARDALDAFHHPYAHVLSAAA